MSDHGALQRLLGLDPSKPLDLAALPASLWHNQQTHTSIMLGHPTDRYSSQRGAVLKLICDSTGGIIELPCDSGARPTTAYPRCRYCGLVFGGGRVIEAEVMVDTDDIDAWPALPWWPDAEPWSPTVATTRPTPPLPYYPLP